jgi:RHS repeat-associated protein
MKSRNAYAAIFILIILARTIGAQCKDCDSSPYLNTCTVSVPTAFRGHLCSTSNAMVTLAGVTAQTNGMRCTENSWSIVPRSFVNLTPNKSYQLTISGGSCSSHVNLEAPEGYYFEIDEKTKATIDRPGTIPGQGDGSFKVVLREKCPCTGDGSTAGSSTGTKVGSLIWSVGLGELPNGKSAGTIGIYERAITEKTYRPISLVYTPPANEAIEVINPNQILRQIRTPRVIADIVEISSWEFEIRFYDPSQAVTKSAGAYQMAGTAHTVWKVRNPNPPAIGRIQFLKTDGETITGEESSYNASTNSWSVTNLHAERTETAQETIDTSTGERKRTRILVDKTAEFSKVTQIYFKYPWGEELIRESVEVDDTPLNTLYDYYQESTDEGRYRKVRSIQKSDGSWEFYDYDKYGNRVLEMRPWKDQSFSGATEQNSRAIYYTYTNFDGMERSLYPRLIESIEEKIAGVLVRKETFSRTAAVEQGEPVIRETVTRYSSQDGSQSTTTTRFSESATAWLRNSIVSIEYTDGRIDRYSYEKGSYILASDPAESKFVPSQTGEARRESIYHLHKEFPDGVPNQSTLEQVIRDERANIVLKETHFFNGTRYIRFNWTAFEYNQRGQLIRTLHSNGTMIEAEWKGDLQTRSVDEKGIETLFTYDGLARVRTKVKKGLNVADSPTQQDIRTIYEYTPDGNIKSEAISSGDLTRITLSEYDGAGRLRQRTEPNGLTTTYSYPNSGRTEVAILPGGSSKILEKYLDGQTKSISGNSEVSKFYSYNITATGMRVITEFTGSADASSPRWKRTFLDWMDRTIEIQTPTAARNISSRIYSFNSHGQTEKETVLVEGKRVIADKLFSYDKLGNQVRSGLDLDGDNQLTLQSNDRIVDVPTSFAAFEDQGEPHVYRISYTITYDRNNSDHPTQRSVMERLNGYWPAKQEQISSYRFEYDEMGNRTVHIAMVDRARKREIEWTYYPQSERPIARLSYNGLLTETYESSHEGVTSYYYTGLGQISKIVSPTLTIINNYNKQGQLESVTHGEQKFSYEYYPQSHINAGKVKSVNSGGKLVYYSYTSLGNVARIWGNMVYPQEYIFNNIGEKTELRTFRKGEWNKSNWPVDAEKEFDSTRFLYNESTGKLAQKVYATGQNVSYGYDDLGRLILREWARSDGVGRVSTYYAYNHAGDLESKNYSDRTAGIELKYDRSGKLWMIKDAAGVKTLSYNTIGSLTNEEFIEGPLTGLKTEISYDPFSRRKSLNVSLGAILHKQEYGYDSRSNLQSISSRERTITYTYGLATGQLENATYSTGANVSRTYDELGRLKTIINSIQSGTVTGQSYAYNESNQRTFATREDGSYWLYEYNRRGEVSSARRFFDDTEIYEQDLSYDNIGNRISESVLETVNYSTNGLNQYTESSKEKFEYDADGNLTVDGKWSYGWDGENRLSWMENGSGLRLEFEYDFLGRRIEKKVLAGRAGNYSLLREIRFIYDGWNLVAELNSQNQLVRSYTWGQDFTGSIEGEGGGVGGLLLVTDNARTYEVAYDGNHNVVALLDSTSNEMPAFYDYDAFGNQLLESGEPGNPFRFSTKYTDSETGLVYYGNRYYNPAQGRWINRDPLEEDGGLNLYGFVTNDPVNKVDPLGLYEIDVHYYLTYWLAIKTGCFTDKEARMIAEGNQKTDEDTATKPAFGGTEEQRKRNSLYHGLHPHDHTPFLNAHWQNASKNESLPLLGRYLHYFQDTYSHSGYIDPKWGHSPRHFATHRVDKTDYNVNKAMRMARQTWEKLSKWAKTHKCDCTTKWDESWWETIKRFSVAPGGNWYSSRRYSIDDPNTDPKFLLNKIQILGVPVRR